MVVTISAMIAINSCKRIEIENIYPGHGNPTESAHIVTEWYNLEMQMLLQKNSLMTGDSYAYLGIGLYESVRHGVKNSVSLSTQLYQMPAMPSIENYKSYNWQVSANAVMADQLRSFNTGLTPVNLASIDSLENLFNQILEPACGTPTYNRSRAFGKSIAAAVHAWSLSDNFNKSNVGYVPPVFFGAWVPTPPFFANGVNPYIGEAKVMLAANEMKMGPPFSAAYSEVPGSDFYNIVKKVYAVSKTLTDEQKRIALFWVDQGDGVGVTNHAHDFSLVTQALINQNSNLFEAAEAYAKGGIAEREAAILCFRMKYKYNVMRPVTYIKKVIDPLWQPFIITPPHPEYPAAHAFVTGSVMEAVSTVLRNNVSITDHTYDFRGWSPRTFSTLIKAAEEAGISRLYGGIHYLPSIEMGLSQAHELSKEIVKVRLYY